MTDGVDVQAERRRALLRRQERDAETLQNGRAKRVLELQWNAAPDALRERIQILWPRMPGPEMEQLLVDTLKVQKSERRPLALDTRALRPPPAVEPRKEFPGVVSVFEMEQRPMKRETIMPKTAKKSESASAKSTRILACLEKHLRAGEKLTGSVVQEIVRRELAITLSSSLANYYRSRALEAFAKLKAEATPASTPTAMVPPPHAAPPADVVVEEEPEITDPVHEMPPLSEEVERVPRSLGSAGKFTAALGTTSALVVARSPRSIVFDPVHVHVLRFAGVDEEAIDRAVRLAEFINTIPEPDHG